MKKKSRIQKLDGGIKTPMSAETVATASGVFPNSTVDNGSKWMGPLNPPLPVLTGQQSEDIRGRQFDFPVGVNLRYQPRSGEAVSFAQMRALADSYDIMRLVIETRKDQLGKLQFSVRPKQEHAKQDSRCQEVEDFLQKPDGENNWHSWIRQLVEEMLVTDSATIYPWLTNGGKPYRFELLDGATIKRVLDGKGRTPAPPLPAYQQVLKGLPVVNYTQDELVYFPRNKRVHKIYGYSPVEQVIMTVNIAIRRQLHLLQYYTEGSTPDLLFQVPPEWNMTQIKEFNDWWQDCLSGNTAQRRKAQFVPHGITPINTKEMILKDPIDEWLTRIVCYAFSVSAQPFIRENNRATAETAHKAALQEGLNPLMLWIKNTIDFLIEKYFGYGDICFHWKDEEELDKNVQSQIDDRNLRNGSQTLDEIRASRGDAPYGTEWSSKPMVLLGTGYASVEPSVAPELETVPVQGNAATPRQGRAQAQESTVTKGDVAEPDPVFQKSNSKSVPQIKKDTEKRAQIEKNLASAVEEELQYQSDAIKKRLLSDSTPLDVDKIDLETDSLMGVFKSSFEVSGKQGVADASIQIDFPSKNNDDALNLANEDAIAYARERSAELVGKRVLADGTVIENPNAEYSITEATREMLRGDITQAIEEGMSNDKLAAILEENYAFSSARAVTIARTETALANCNGNAVIYKNSGIVASKQWIVGENCCDECAEVNGEIVPLDENFSNDVKFPPAHPNCRCDFIPILNEEEK